MLALNTFVAILAFATPFLVRADVTPSEPAPGDVFNEGSNCVVTWVGDTNSTTTWKGMAIELMTGSNYPMVHLTTVATNLDGTVTGSFTYPCPAVTPNAPIYFYQFTSSLALSPQWTGRWTIATSTGQSTPAPNSTTSGGVTFSWGIGTLVNPSQAVAAPSFVTGSSASASLTLSTANSSIPAVTSSSTGAPASSNAGSGLTGGTTIVSSSSGSPTNSANTTVQSNTTKSSALGATIGSNTKVLGAVTVATLAFSLVW